MMRVILIILLSIFLASCGEYENMELQKRLDKRVDSIFYAQKDSIKKNVDSFCVKNYNQMYETAIDSIKKNHLTKIEELIKK